MTPFTEIFKTLQAIDCREHIEKKNDLSYLSWSWAWGYVAQRYEASYEVLTDKQTELPFFEAPGMGYLVRTRVTIEGHTREMWLPAMSSDNRALQAVPFEITRRKRDGGTFTATIPPCDMMDINKTIMRCLVKNLAMFGLGLYIYAGEDLPLELDAEPVEVKRPTKKAGKPSKAPAAPALDEAPAAGDLAGTVFDDNLLIALDDLRRVKCRADLVDVYHTYAGVYYKGGTAENAKFVEEMDAKLAAYPRTSATSDK